jgi:predicted nucleic acid-binding Zn ribbon protein
MICPTCNTKMRRYIRGEYFGVPRYRYKCPKCLFEAS